MRDAIRVFLLCSTLVTANSYALTYANLDECLATAVNCKRETEQLLSHEEVGSRDWFMLMYYNLSARWELDNLSISTDELAQYANMKDAPDVFNIVVYTVYAKKLITDGDIGTGTHYAYLARDLITHSVNIVPDPHRLAELIILHNYLKDYDAAESLAEWASARTEHIKNPFAKAPLNMAIGHVAWFKKDYSKALKYYSLVAEAYERINEPLQLSYALTNVGMVYRKLKAYGKARRYFEEAKIALDQALGTYETKDRSYIEMRLIELDFLEGNAEKAIAALQTIRAEEVHEHHQPLYKRLMSKALAKAE